MEIVVVAADGSVDFTSQWNKLISAPWLSGLLSVLGVVGIAIVALSILGWVWKKRRGGGGGSGFPIFPVIIGAILASPKFVIPVLLIILQWVATFAVQAVEWFGNLGGAGGA